MSNYNKMDIGKSFTETELRSLIGDDLKIITPDNRRLVIDMLSLCSQMKSHVGRAMIFYQTGYDIVNEIRNGHWCCVAIRYPNVYFFDSLGLFPDDELNKIPAEYRIRTNQNERVLGHILYEAKKKGYNIHYNDVKLQEDKPGINTCGRYCAMFLTEAIREPNPYFYMTETLGEYRKKGERYFDKAIVRYSMIK